MLRNRNELDGPLKQAFAQGVRWPIERPSLNASPNWASPV